MIQTPARLFQRLSIVCATAVAAALGQSACRSVPVENTALNEARNNLRIAQANPQTRSLASTELRVAADALARAEAAVARGEPLDRVNHLSYLARQCVSLAREVGIQKGVAAAGEGGR